MLTSDARSEPDLGGIPEPIGWLDELTGLEGPDFWRRTLVSEIARSTRYHRPLTVVILEVDGIAGILRDMGPEPARFALRDIAQTVRRSSRTSDQCVRIGPARFGIVLTETDEIAAINFVERVREAAPRSEPSFAGRLHVRLGWASPRLGEAAESVVRRALDRMASDSED